MAKKNNYFVVWVGKQTGIFTSWAACKEQVEGFAGALYKGFATEEDAKKALARPYWESISKESSKASKKPLSKSNIILESLSVDAACSGNPGLMEYRGVYTKTGEQIFHQGPFKNGTNNIGEFLALVHGIAFLKNKQSQHPIYSDSITAIAWVRNKKAKTNLEKNETNAVLFDLIERAENWLKTNTYDTPILKWETQDWGEIPADFGRK